MVGTLSALSIKATINVVGIMVCDPLDWSVLPMGSENRIYNYFGCCLVLLYECLFTKIGLRLSFSNFEVVVLKQLKVSLS